MINIDSLYYLISNLYHIFSILSPLSGLEVVEFLISVESEVLDPLRSHLKNMRKALNRKVMKYGRNFDFCCLIRIKQ